MRSSLTVTLRGLRFHARVGVLPHERELAQPLEIDVTVWAAPEPATPSRHALIDYRFIYDRVAAVVARQPLGLLEDLVHAIAQDVLALDGASRVSVVARKPHVPLPGPLTCSEVALELARDA